MLKCLWDMVWLVRSSFSDWNKTFWSDINVEMMETECKKFVKVRYIHTYVHTYIHKFYYATCTSTYSIQDIRSLDKEMRAWDAFTGLDSTVKNMVTSLRAVGELQNPAIRERHWQQLMQATQVCQYGIGVYEKNVKLGQLFVVVLS